MSLLKRFTVGILLAGLAALAPAGAATAQTVVGVTPTEIKIGHTNPYSGNASAYGTIGKTIAAYFKKVNDEGGVNGRKINFISYDDGYSPPKTVEMIRKLVEQDQVAFVFQTLGTPPNTAIQKYLNQQKVPHLFVATGATKWNDPKNFPWTMGYQPNYQTEGRVYAAYALSHVKDAKIGILYQNDDYGKDYLKGFEDGLGEANKKLIVMKQTYEVTDPTIESQIVNLKNSGANGFFNNVAILMTQVLKQCGNDFSRENIMKQAASVKDFELPLLLPGIKVNTGPTDHAPIEQEQLAKFDGEKWALFGEILEAIRK